MTNAVVNRLGARRDELEEELQDQYQGGSQRRATLQYQINKIGKLIEAYGNSSSLLTLQRTEEILSQQVGFEEQKKQILDNLAIEEFCEQHNIKKNSLVLCLVGPPGVGKTTFAKILAQALGKAFFPIALGGLSEPSILVGNETSSPENDMGQLAKALVKTNSRNPLILLDEIDKAGSSFKTAIHDHLNSVLDPVQNQEIPDYLCSRMLIVELPGYTTGQKKEIANKIIKNWLDQNEEGIDQDKLDISSEALEALINKTNEKGVRQLKMALNSIFEHCILQ